MHKSPLLISGIGRSGTSAVISSMSKHKLVVEPNRVGEAPFFYHFVQFLIDYEDESPDREYHHENYQLDKQGRGSEFSRLLSQVQYGFDVEEADHDKEFWIAKVSLKKDSYLKCCEIFDNLRIIYVMRNGIEVVNSAKSFSGFKNFSFEQLCRRWASNLEECRYVHTAPNCAVVRHDELVQDPYKVYEKVYERLQLEIDPAPAQFISSTLFNSSFDESSSIDSTRSVFKGRLECWADWTEEEKDTFIQICDPYMQEFDFSRPYTSSTSRGKYVANISPAVVSPETHDFTQRDFLDLVEGRMTVPQFDYHANPSIISGYMFMENPKVASTSTLKVLQRLEDSDLAEQMTSPHARSESPIPMFSRLPGNSKRRMLESDEIFRFTFVRDPYSRLLSAYLSKIARSLLPKTEILAVLQGKTREEVTQLDLPVSFEEFVSVVCAQEPIEMDHHWKLQVDQILLHKIKYNFIGKFENLEEDFSKVVEMLFGAQNVQLEQSKNMTQSSSKIKQYYTPAIEEMVFKKYEEDFSAFGYDRYLLEALAA